MYSSTGPSSVSSPVEFELTRNQHMADTRATSTVTAMFKDPPEGLIGEAWRILLAATNDKLLLPEHVQQYWKKHVAKWGSEERVSDSSPGAPATCPPPSKRGKRGATSPEPPVGEPEGEAPTLGLPTGPSAAVAYAAPSPSSPGNAGARPSSASQALRLLDIILWGIRIMGAIGEGI